MQMHHPSAHRQELKFLKIKPVPENCRLLVTALLPPAASARPTHTQDRAQVQYTKSTVITPAGKKLFSLPVPVTAALAWHEHHTSNSRNTEVPTLVI